MGDKSFPPLVEARTAKQPGEVRQYAVLIKTKAELKAFLDHFKDKLTDHQVKAINSLTPVGEQFEGDVLLFALEGRNSGEDLKPVQVFEGRTFSVPLNDPVPKSGIALIEPDSDTIVLRNKGSLPQRPRFDKLTQQQLYISLDKDFTLREAGAIELFQHLNQEQYASLGDGLSPSARAYNAADHQGDPLPPGFPGGKGARILD
jgi:hypothetical protein